VPERRAMVEKQHSQLSVKAQCKLLSIHRSGLYYQPCGESSLNLHLMRRIDEHFLKHPYKGTRRMAEWLKEAGYEINRKRIQKLYRKMGLEVLYPKPDLSKADKKKYKYPYLLKGAHIGKPNDAWAIDITYIPMAKGFMYLAAIIDLHSRYVVNWSVSNTMSSAWIVELVREAIKRHGSPVILNSDQGSQFTSDEYINLLKDNNIRISMDGKGRAADNIFIERLWRSLKYEHVYLNPADDGLALYKGLSEWFRFYNHERHHQTLEYQKPVQLYRQAA
jgi:putative transposase